MKRDESYYPNDYLTDYEIRSVYAVAELNDEPVNERHLSRIRGRRSYTEQPDEDYPMAA